MFSEQVRRKRGATNEKVLEQIEDVSLWLSQARAPAFYFEQNYGEQDAQRAYRDALLVVTELPKILGLRGEPA